MKIEERLAVDAAEADGFWRCDCGFEDGLPHCGWWFKDDKAYVASDLVEMFRDGRLSHGEAANTVKTSKEK